MGIPIPGLRERLEIVGRRLGMREYTQKELADRLGVKPQTFTMWLRGYKDSDYYLPEHMSSARVDKVCNLAGIPREIFIGPIEEFLDWDSKNNPPVSFGDTDPGHSSLTIISKLEQNDFVDVEKFEPYDQVLQTVRKLHDDRIVAMMACEANGASMKTAYGNLMMLFLEKGNKLVQHIPCATINKILNEQDTSHLSSNSLIHINLDGEEQLNVFKHLGKLNALKDKLKAINSVLLIVSNSSLLSRHSVMLSIFTWDLRCHEVLCLFQDASPRQKIEAARLIGLYGASCYLPILIKKMQSEQNTLVCHALTVACIKLIARANDIELDKSNMIARLREGINALPKDSLVQTAEHLISTYHQA